MAAIQIRPVNSTDVPHLMSIDHSSSSEYVWQLELRREPAQVLASFREVRLPRPVSLAYPRDPFSLGDDWNRMAALLAAFSEKDPLGYIGLWERREPAAWVGDLVVAPAWRRRGVGGALLEAAREWADERGHRRIFMEMQSKNQPAIHLAQKHGFEFCGYNDHYYSTQDVALFFVRAV